MGIYFRNTDAQSPVIKFLENGQTQFTYITTGGDLEIFFMVKQNAKGIIKEYHKLIGKPKLLPMWHLGWHASGNYKDQAEIEKNVEGYQANGFPLEGVWIDHNWMENS